MWSRFTFLLIAAFFILSVIVMVLIWLRDNLPRSYDLQWFRKSVAFFTRGEHIPSGRYNAGEKVWFWFGVIGLSIVVSWSGLILLFPNFDQVRAVMILANITHAIAAVLVVAMSMGHIYLGTIGVEGAYRAMRNGYVDESWAGEHHGLWYEDVKSGKVKAGKATGTPQSAQVQH